jgi:hypothetical protein
VGQETLLHMDMYVYANMDYNLDFCLILVNWVVLIANLLGGTLILGIDDGTTFGLSILYCILFIPLSYICWFRPAYNAFRNNSLINYILFFITFSFQFCFSVLMAIGIPNTGSSGVVIAMLTFRKRKSGTGDYFFGTIILLITLGFSLAAAMQLFIIIKVNKYEFKNHIMLLNLIILSGSQVLPKK